MLTQDTLKSIFHYDPETGVFTRLIKNKISGTFDKTTGYIVVWCDKKLYLAHRLAFLYMTGSFPKNQIDHINGIRHDNRFVNIRPATNSENSINKSIHPKNTSGYKGVYLSSQDGKWKAKININCKQVHIGTFNSPIEANVAYIKKAKELHGEFYHG